MSGNDKRRSRRPCSVAAAFQRTLLPPPQLLPWLAQHTLPASLRSITGFLPAVVMPLAVELQLLLLLLLLLAPGWLWLCCAAGAVLRAPALPRGRAAPRLAVRRVGHAVGRTPQAVHRHARLRHVGVGLHVRVGQACGELRLRQQRWTRWRPCLAGICCSGRRRRAALGCCCCAWLSRLAGKPRQLFTAITAGLYSGWRAVGCRVQLLRRIGGPGHKAQLQAAGRCCRRPVLLASRHQRLAHGVVQQVEVALQHAGAAAAWGRLSASGTASGRSRCCRRPPWSRASAGPSPAAASAAWLPCP